MEFRLVLLPCGCKEQGQIDDALATTAGKLTYFAIEAPVRFPGLLEQRNQAFPTEKLEAGQWIGTGKTAPECGQTTVPPAEQTAEPWTLPRQTQSAYQVRSFVQDSQCPDDVPGIVLPVRVHVADVSSPGDFRPCPERETTPPAGRKGNESHSGVWTPGRVFAGEVPDVFLHFSSRPVIAGVIDNDDLAGTETGEGFAAFFEEGGQDGGFPVDGQDKAQEDFGQSDSSSPVCRR